MTLKELTSNKHSEAENHPFIKLVLNKEISAFEYAFFLSQKFDLYFKLEQVANKLNLLNDIADIQRVKKIKKDLKEFDLTNIFTLKNTNKYIAHLDNIKTDTEKVLSHVYVHHMGDMMGGQILKKLVPGSGNMYDFDHDIKILAFNLRKKLNINMAEESILAFDFTINIFDELFYELRKKRQ